MAFDVEQAILLTVLSPRFAAILTLAGLLWAGLVWTAPALAAAEAPAALAVAGVTYTVGALVCHQQPERSFHLGGVRAPVCARCAGLYTGLALGLLAWWGSRRRVWGAARGANAALWLALAAAPTAVTWAAAFAGLWDPDNLTRALVAGPLGLVGGSLVAAVTAGELE